MSIEGKTDQPKSYTIYNRPRGDEPCYPADGGIPLFYQGLTIREHLAGLAMPVLLADIGHGEGYEKVAQRAVMCADALLAELAGGEEYQDADDA